MINLSLQWLTAPSNAWLVSFSCKFGTRCKFLHPTQKQTQTQTQTNPFGFGNQTGTPIQHSNPQQSKPNPFGLQNNAHSRAGYGFGSQPNQFKPFENKWSRSSHVNNSNASAPSQSGKQPPTANHECTDPESCKRAILDDLENEKPLWKLTCYGHRRDGPCDIVGDISYEELRALAYNDAKHGKSLQSIVERERDMLNSKLLEFQNLAQKLCTVSSAPTPSSQNLFTGGNTNAPVVNNGFSSQVSSFSQLNGSLNTRSATAPNYSFGQLGALQNTSQPFGFSQTNNSLFNSSGAFGNQPQQSIQGFSSFGTTSSMTGATSAQRNPFSTPTTALQTGNMIDKNFDFFTKESSSSSSTFGQTTTITQLTNNITKENTNVDGSIWEKAEWKWNVGEIPEEAPPDAYIH